MFCISWLPRDSPSSHPDVSTPETTAAPGPTRPLITPQSVRNSKGFVLRQSHQRAVTLVVMHDRAAERGRAKVIRLRADLRHRPEQERAESIEVLAEDAECRICGHRLHVG